jgi:hypothetical protein
VTRTAIEAELSDRGRRSHYAALLYERRECRGIRAITPPVSPIGIGKFVCQIQRTLLTLCTHYATMLKFSNLEWRHVRDFSWIKRKRFHATL